MPADETPRPPREETYEDPRSQEDVIAGRIDLVLDRHGVGGVEQLVADIADEGEKLEMRTLLTRAALGTVYAQGFADRGDIENGNPDGDPELEALARLAVAIDESADEPGESPPGPVDEGED